MAKLTKSIKRLIHLKTIAIKLFRCLTVSQIRDDFCLLVFYLICYGSTEYHTFIIYNF